MRKHDQRDYEPEVWEKNPKRRTLTEEELLERLLAEMEGRYDEAGYLVATN